MNQHFEPMIFLKKILTKKSRVYNFSIKFNAIFDAKCKNIFTRLVNSNDLGLFCFSPKFIKGQDKYQLTSNLPEYVALLFQILIALIYIMRRQPSHDEKEKMTQTGVQLISR